MSAFARCCLWVCLLFFIRGSLLDVTPECWATREYRGQCPDMRSLSLRVLSSVVFFGSGAASAASSSLSATAKRCTAKAVSSSSSQPARSKLNGLWRSKLNGATRRLLAQHRTSVEASARLSTKMSKRWRKSSPKRGPAAAYSMSCDRHCRTAAGNR